MLYAVAMVAVVVGVDVLFFPAPWERLAANVGIVLVFGAFLLQVSAPHIGAAGPLLLRVIPEHWPRRGS